MSSGLYKNTFRVNPVLKSFNCQFDKWKLFLIWLTPLAAFAFQWCHLWNSIKRSIRLLLWRHNGRGSVSNHQTHDYLLNRLFRRRSKKTSKLRVTGHCAGNSPGTGEFPAQMASNAENVSIWWCHHVMTLLVTFWTLHWSLCGLDWVLTILHSSTPCRYVHQISIWLVPV